MAEAALRIGGAAGSAEPRSEAGDDGRPGPRRTETDVRDDLGDEIARLAAHIHAATRRYLELVAEFDRREGWLSVVPDDDGMYVIRGRLTPEVGAVLRRAIEAAEDALYQQEPTPGSAEQGCSAEHPSPRQARLEARRLWGANPAPLDAGARWRRERDVPDDVWFPAVEAGMAAAAPP